MTQAGIPTLTTPRLTLRGPKASDAAALAAFMVSPRAQGIGGPYPDDSASEWLDWQRENWATFGRGLWIVALRDQDCPIGRIGLLDHADWPEPELAWLLFDGFEGHGYAQEAACAVRTYAAETLRLPPLFSFIEPGNRRSLALARRLGATAERDVTVDGVSLTVYRHPAPEGGA
ncbi:MAG: hypothetical protein B7Y02_12965 [Rhodobacterales bacterium 17-64-5]|nr:MAG: hypothetical protein B7Y02_12965 [Rhodobacterales bacterium 17-64-5]